VRAAVAEPGSDAAPSPAGPSPAPAAPSPSAGSPTTVASPGPAASAAPRPAARGARPVAVRSFVALGDSFSEGVGDPWPDGTACRGWADRLAEILAEQTPGLRYANLAIRGKMLAQVLNEQVPAAAAMRADLVSIAAGGNDLLRPSVDPDQLAEPFNRAIEQLTAVGSRVVIFAGFDPSLFPLIRMIRRRAAIFNAHVRAIARQHDCVLVDLWAMRVLNDPRMWCDDRLHMSPEGHRRVALRTAEELGVPVEASWREPLPPLQRDAGAVPAWLAARRLDAEWARAYAAPWVRRRLAGVSSGDDMFPKRPDLLPL
jgi:lysophospholipase L1-like esterase